MPSSFASRVVREGIFSLSPLSVLSEQNRARCDEVNFSTHADQQTTDNWSLYAVTIDTPIPFTYPITIDTVALPHVLSIKVTEKTNLESLNLATGSVLARTYEGRVGRAYTITGWTKLLSDLSTLMGYVDGATHTFVFNTETITVLVVSVPEPRKAADGIIVYPYTLVLVEYGT